MPRAKGIKPMAQNKKAFHDYFVEERLECGMELKGTEVKSMRAGRMNLKESFAVVKNGEVLVSGMHISPYEMGNRFNHEPKRPRRLLLHKQEISRLYAKAREKGLTIIPTKVYFSHGKVKVEIALSQGKKLYDKREDAARKDMRREADRALKERNA